MKRKILFSIISLTILTISFMVTVNILAQIEERNLGTPECNEYRDTDGKKCFDLKCRFTHPSTPSNGWNCPTTGGGSGQSYTINMCEYNSCRKPTDILSCETDPPNDNAISYSFEDCDGEHKVDTAYIVCPIKCTKCITPPNGYGQCPQGYFKRANCCIPREVGGGGGCLSGKTIEGKESKDGDSADLCSPCNPTQQELDECWMSGGNYDWASCFCGGSPIVIDVLGNGFNLTSAEDGIQFDLNGDDNQEQIAWSSANSDDAWLALDRNNNGTIDDGKELFGNSTEQPAPPAGEMKNGFLALAEFDKAENGGNADGKINRFDSVFENLRLWQDVNHNGISETNELKTVSELGLRIIELDYRESRRTDEFGNRFKYRAKVKDAQGSQLGRWAWDVYLVIETTQNNNLNNVKIYK